MSMCKMLSSICVIEVFHFITRGLTEKAGTREQEEVEEVEEETKGREEWEGREEEKMGGEGGGYGWG